MLIDFAASSLPPIVRSSSGSSTGTVGVFLAAGVAIVGLYSTVMAKVLFWRNEDRERHSLSDKIHQQLAYEVANEGQGHEVVKIRGRLVRNQAGIAWLAPDKPIERLRILVKRSEEINSLFRNARLAFYSFLSMIVASSSILIYGAYLAISGHIAAGVIVALADAIPGGFTAGLYRISQAADRRADDALKILDRDAEREFLMSQALDISSGLGDHPSRDSLQAIGALHAMFPTASPEELASLVNVMHIETKTADGELES